MDDILDRLPPQNIQAEIELLGSVLIEPRILDDVSSVLSADDFYADSHKVLYKHFVAMNAAGQNIDAILLLDRLRISGDIERVGGAAYIYEVGVSVAVPHHWRSHAEIVLRDSKRRKIIHAATRMARSAYEDSTPDDTLADAERALQAIQTGTYDTDPVSMDVAAVNALQAIHDQIRNKTKPGIMVGLEKFDALVGGVFQSELTVLGARPANGKTSLALQAAAHIAGRGRKVLFQSVEMNREELATKQLCTVSGVSNQLLRTGQATAEHLEQMMAVAHLVGIPNLVIDDNPSARPYDIARSVRRVKPDVLFVDYLQIVTPETTNGVQRYEQIGGICKGLRHIARTHKIPVVVCAQIGRSNERENELPPEMRHLRESGDIEQDCDMILLLWRPKRGIPKQGKDGGYEEWAGELEVAKNRKGVTGTIKLTWDADRTLFGCHSLTGEWTPDSAF